MYNISTLENSQETGKKYLIVIIKVFVTLLVLLIIALLLFNFNKTKDIEKQAVVQATIPEMSDSLRNGDVDAAIQAGEALLELNTNSESDISALVYLARAYLQDGNESFSEELSAEKAFAVIERIIAIDPKLAEAYRLRGYAHEITNNFEAAVVDYNTALEFDATYALVYAHLGHVESLLGNKDEAYDYFDKALSLDATIELAQLGIAYILYEEREFDDVLDILTKIKLNAQDDITLSEAEMLEGLIALEQGDYLDAEVKLQKSVATYSEDAQAWAALSTVYVALIVTSNDFETALATYERDLSASIESALALHPQNTYAKANKGNLYALKDDCEFALDYYEEAKVSIFEDITLGVNEKRLANEYITNAINNCSQ